MRILILGATGKTGRQLIDLGLERGHTLTAFVRSPGKIKRAHVNLAVVEGDPFDADQLSRVLPGHDAVVSALGSRPPRAFRPHALVERGAESTVAAMARSNVRRLLLVSAAVLFPERGLVFAFFRWLLKHIARDLKAAEQIVETSTLDWTIARPPRLTGGSDEHYRASAGALPKPARAMSFRAVAAFLLDAVEKHDFSRQLVGLAR
jgi:putative NADH-flavin reductase